MSNSNIIFQSWTDLKTYLISPKFLSIQYIEYDDYYDIFVLESNIRYFTELWKDTTKVSGINVSQNDSDLTDFENNYKSSSNNPLSTIITKQAKFISGKVNITGTDQLILEYTVPVGKTLYVTEVITGGSKIDRKILKINSAIILRFYNSDNDSKPYIFKNELKVADSEVITIKSKVATSGIHIATIIGVLQNG